MALIELDLAAQPDPSPGSAPPPGRYRIPGLLLAAVLAVALGGAAPTASLLWRQLGTVPVIGGDEAPFELAGDRIYTVDTTGSERVTTAWQLRSAGLSTTPRRLWTARSPARAAGPDDVGFSRVDAQEAGDVVLISDGPATTAVDAATGRFLWTAPVGVTPLPGDRVGIVQSQDFRAGTVYDQNSGAPGMLYFSSTGEPHTEPPIHTEVRGVDLHSGRTLWAQPVGGSVNVFAAPGAPSAVLILSAGRLERRDGDTGAVQQQIPLPKIGQAGPAAGDLIDGTLLVYYYESSSTTAGQEVAYAPDTLRKLWTHTRAEIILDPPSCGDVLCHGGRDALDVLDPVTGQARWRAPADVDLTRRAGYVLELVTRSGLPRQLVDPVTGRPRLDLTGWRAEVGGATDQPLVLRRARDDRTNVFGVVPAGRNSVQPLGVAIGPVSDCVADQRYVVCRGTEGLRIWAYRA